MPSVKIPEEPYTIEGVMNDLGRQFGAGAGTAAAEPPSVATGVPAADVDAALRHAERAMRVAPDYKIQSHRAVVGPLIDAVKRFLHWGTRPYLDRAISQQERFNAAAVKTLAALREAHESQRAAGEAELRALQAAAEELREAIARGREEFARERETQSAELRALRANAGALAEALDHERMEAVRRATELAHRDRSIEERARALEARHDLGPFFSRLSKQQRLDLMNKFRGAPEEIAHRQHVYIPIFRGRPGRILDVGCGRGEFLDVLRHEGIESWGCEVDPAMIEASRARDVYVLEGDALATLRNQPAGSLGGVFAAQVVEHMFPGELLEFLTLSFEKLAEGGAIVLETLNPQALGVLAKSYSKDLDHKQPIDPDYLAELVRLAGFANVRVERTMPFEEPEAPAPLPPAESFGLPEEGYAALQRWFAHLKDAIWGPQDYYIFAEKPAGASAP